MPTFIRHLLYFKREEKLLISYLIVLISLLTEKQKDISTWKYQLRYFQNGAELFSLNHKMFTKILLPEINLSR